MTAVSVGPSAFRLLLWRHPEWWVIGLVTTAWLILAGQLLPSEHAVGHHGHAAGVAGPVEYLAPLLGGSAVMVLAMMAPLAIPGARHVAYTSFWNRRHRAQAMFLAGYLAVWTGVGATLTLAAVGATSILGPTPVLAVATTFAASWQLTKAKQRALRRCRRTVSLTPYGWRADVDCLRFGVATATTCVATCCGVMALAAASGHLVVVLALLAGLQLRERIAPRADPRRIALAIAGLGIVLVASSLPVPA